MSNPDGIGDEKKSGAPALLRGKLEQYIAALCVVAIASHL
jgi:hypothetical protein